MDMTYIPAIEINKGLSPKKIMMLRTKPKLAKILDLANINHLLKNLILFEDFLCQLRDQRFAFQIYPCCKYTKL